MVCPLALFKPPKRPKRLPGRVAARGGWIYSAFLPAAFTIAHLALAAAASLALTAGLLRRSFFLAALTFAHLALVPAIMAALPAALNRFLPFFALPLILAQRALAAAAILARTAAELRRRRFVANADGIPPPPSAAIDSIWLCSASICSMMARMLLSWLTVNSVRFVMVYLVMPR